MNEPLRPAPMVPISWGELLDKLTILEIKVERFAGDAALANVRKEHDRLAEIVDALEAAPAALADLRAALKAANRQLWELEDGVRRAEAEGSFDDSFVAQARAIYQTNDRRARIKRQISVLLGSDLIEEKQYTAYGDER